MVAHDQRLGAVKTYISRLLWIGHHGYAYSLSRYSYSMHEVHICYFPLLIAPSNQAVPNRIVASMSAGGIGCNKMGGGMTDGH